ncbi:MAG: CAP domain-containing protein, partial [Myxococcota bacterium]|nr:CAP domain-containing protein [Myxococcota bacterium]
ILDMEPPRAPDMAPPPPVDPMAPPESAEMLVLVNAFRATGGTCGGRAFPPVGPLTWDPLLEAAAQGHAEDMANQNYFDHQSLDGRNPGDRISAAGYQWMTYGENIAAGQGSVQAAFEGWVSSPGHCENMLRDRFEDFGFGFAENPATQYGRYWVQKFGTSR